MKKLFESGFLVQICIAILDPYPVLTCIVLLIRDSELGQI